jgi:hypothetical protein
MKSESQNLFQEGNHMKFNGLILVVLAALLLGACADTSSRYRGSDSMINLAYNCATCGASIQDNYFAGSAFKAMGPGSY